ncbi:hypothetical protein CEE37_03075 [candidate division LCP-89 bacterium B3_LCP]|uniref:Uncharacterized protein n=1 Tax=candidate division LCP-89 bacterium B3_LCP TaxID=2012998 RepID=A0A532V359_UNCL8|nr:MAG: hypothetical protein CEE37_03075 [candidate division LCP-89 bacterium B3_LCP]
MGALNSIYHLYKLKRRLFWSEDKLKELQRRKLNNLLNYCYQHIPYYREQFQHIGAQPGDFKSPADLVNFPILEKETLRDNADQFVDPKADRSAWIKYHSSGSTGIPLELWYTPAERLRMGHTVTRELLHNGLRPWYRMVNITEPRHSASKDKWYHRLGFMNEKFLSVYDQSNINIEKLREIGPHLIIGFPSSLMLIGDKQARHSGEHLKPKLLFTLAEVLTDADREILKNLWGTEPIDLYGANEVGHIAFQCHKRQGYHINLDSLHVEIITSDRPVSASEKGEVVVTNLDLRVMPIIRYRVGDIASMIEDQCSCGCRFPLMGKIAGRSNGFIKGADGKLFSALEISLLLKFVKGVAHYRLIQDNPAEIIVEWVTDGSGAEPAPEIENRLRERLGDGTELVIRKVERIEREKSGKIRTVISNLPHPFWTKGNN